MSDSFVRLLEAADKNKKLDAELATVNGLDVYRLRVALTNAGEIGGNALETLALDDAGGGITYIGTAAPGSSENSASWRIKQVLTTGVGLRILWADGDSNYDNVWADRVSLSYS